MYDHIVSLTGKQVNIGQTGLEKIKKMETFLLALEAKKEKENVCHTSTEIIQKDIAFKYSFF